MFFTISYSPVFFLFYTFCPIFILSHCVLSFLCLSCLLILSHPVLSSVSLSCLPPFSHCPVFQLTLSVLSSDCVSHCSPFKLSHSCLLIIFTCLSPVCLSFYCLPHSVFFFQVFLFCFQTMPCPLSHLPLLCFSHSLMLPLSCLSHSVISFDYLHHFVISFVSLFSFS